MPDAAHLSGSSTKQSASTSRRATVRRSASHGLDWRRGELSMGGIRGLAGALAGGAAGVADSGSATAISSAPSSDPRHTLFAGGWGCLRAPG